MTALHNGHSPIRANWEIQPEGQLLLPEKPITHAQILKNSGYSTAIMGKWGMGMFNTTGSSLKKGFGSIPILAVVHAADANVL